MTASALTSDHPSPGGPPAARTRLPPWLVRLIIVVLFAGSLTALHIAVVRTALPGEWSVPIDDTYIHLQYARSIAEGHPFAYHRGDGYSTGSTSPLYALLLALPCLLGVRALMMAPLTFVLGGIWLAASLLLLLRLGRQLGSAVAGTVAAVLWGGWGFVWFCLFSGMETGLYVTLILAALSLFVSWSHGRDPRPGWPLVAVAALLPLVRPDGLFLLAVLLAIGLLRSWARRAAGRRPLVLAGVRWAVTLLPALAYFVVNRALTGTFSTGGMVSKSLLYAPYLRPSDKALQFLTQLLDASKEFLIGADPLYLGFAVAGCGVVALLTLARRERSRRAIGVYTLLALWMITALAAASMHYIRIAQWQRYYLPFFLLLVLGAGFAFSWLAQALRRRHLALAIAATLLFLQAHATMRWVRIFERDVSVIHTKQAGAARAVRQLPLTARVLVCDAGAIPYISGRWTFDIVGLTTPLRYNYFRNGVGSRFELFERLPPARRPTHVAAYDFCLWPGARGPQLSIHHDLVVAPLIEAGAGSGERPGLLLPPGARIVDRVDVADLQSEDEHSFRLQPAGAIQDNVLRRARLPGRPATIVDGGRKVLGTEALVLRATPGQPATLIGRLTTERPTELLVEVNRQVTTVKLPFTPGDLWVEASVALPAARVQRDNHVYVHALGSAPYASYHWFLVQGGLRR